MLYLVCMCVSMLDEAVFLNKDLSVCMCAYMYITLLLSLIPRAWVKDFNCVNMI